MKTFLTALYFMAFMAVWQSAQAEQQKAAGAAAGRRVLLRPMS